MPQDSGSIRTLAILKMLIHEGYDVSYQPTATREPKYANEARFMGVDILPIVMKEKWIMTHKGRCRFDVIVVARRGVYENCAAVLKRSCAGVPIIYDTVDLHFLREARDVLSATKAPGTVSADTWDFESIKAAGIVAWLNADTPKSAAVRTKRDLELGLIDQSNLTLVVSKDEVDIIQHYRPNSQVMVSGLRKCLKQVDHYSSGTPGLDALVLCACAGDHQHP